MFVDPLFHALSWHVIACWVDVIKSLARLIPAPGGDISLAPVSDGKAYVWSPPVLSVLVAVVTTATCVVVTFVVYVFDVRYRKRLSRNDASMKLSAVLHSDVVKKVPAVVVPSVHYPLERCVCRETMVPLRRRP